MGAETTLTRLEEEYDVRLALAISASEPAGLVDPDTVQICAAERISLSGPAAAPEDRTTMEALSARYWNHNVVNYDEKLSDGFYDGYGAPMDPGFQVLADRVNLPCKLVKGICYTGTDEGAINFVKIDFDSADYIVDLMGAPGTLIPSEISASQFQGSNNSQLSNDAIEESVYESRNDMGASSSDHSSVLALTTSHLEDRSHTGNPLKQRVFSDEGQFNVFNTKSE